MSFFVCAWANFIHKIVNKIAGAAGAQPTVISLIALGDLIRCGRSETQKSTRRCRDVCINCCGSDEDFVCSTYECVCVRWPPYSETLVRNSKSSNNKHERRQKILSHFASPHRFSASPLIISAFFHLDFIFNLPNCWTNVLAENEKLAQLIYWHVYIFCSLLSDPVIWFTNTWRKTSACYKANSRQRCDVLEKNRFHFHLSLRRCCGSHSKIPSTFAAYRFFLTSFAAQCYSSPARGFDLILWPFFSLFRSTTFIACG